MNYFVSWEIELCATSPQEAVRRALECICNDAYLARVFRVYDENGKEYVVDLDAQSTITKC
ncbi:MAG: hypothetical protein AB1330_01845 [Bacillota bacterium]